ncbi:MAG: ribosome biogenesis GTPase Der [Verrucomicrobiota bacterium]|nr:ribosome biogenesis GTPase Der [Verrucomicrobiota bacterium]
MNAGRIVAIVGRPNVGKSRLFNRLARKRLAIVHDQPGVTRDVNSTDLEDGYTLLDTGGIGLVAGANERAIYEAVEEQVFISVEAAQLILFVVDGQEGLVSLDEIVLERLRKSGKEIILVVNKLDNSSDDDKLVLFRKLGFKRTVGVSAEHGRGEDDLRELIAKILGPKPEEPVVTEPRRIKICFAGRPNVGKSSLCNALLKSDRLVVSEVPGTTRDSIELDFDYTAKSGEVWPFRLVDTAGLRRITRVRQPVEYFSMKRTEESIDAADVVFMVIDAQEGITKQEQAIAGKIAESGKLHAIIVNKWDIAQTAFDSGKIEHHATLAEYRAAFEDAIRRELFFLADSPIIFASALNGYSIERLLNESREVDARAEQHLSTGRVNALFEKLVQRREPRFIKGKRFRIYYATQTGRRPFRFKVFCNQSGHLDETYRRYLERGFVETFGLQGCPLRFELIGKKKKAGEK